MRSRDVRKLVKLDLLLVSKSTRDAGSGDDGAMGERGGEGTGEALARARRVRRLAWRAWREPNPRGRGEGEGDEEGDEFRGESWEGDRERPVDSESEADEWCVCEGDVCGSVSEVDMLHGVGSELRANLLGKRFS